MVNEKAMMATWTTTDGDGGPTDGQTDDKIKEENHARTNNDSYGKGVAHEKRAAS